MRTAAHQPIMILGTGSHCGKTTIVAGLCRYFADKGLRVAPFKSQNMALNSFVTDSGQELARSIAVQAQGARQTPRVEMNPILLKPKSDTLCQLIIDGQPVRDVTAQTNFLDAQLRAEKLVAIDRSIATLRLNFDLIIAEGAGSCAEPNLAEVDLVNLTVAKRLGARVFVLGDIDVGGVFAQFAGTHEILARTDPQGLRRLEGFVINKFRGDPELLAPGIAFHDAGCPVPICSVLPMLPNLSLEEEDRASFPARPHAPLKIAIPYLPRIANTSDFDLLAQSDDVEIRLVRSGDEFGQPAAVIIPGTKNTIDDLAVLRTSGMAERIKAMAAHTPVFGICGGFQMLGRELNDPHQVESDSAVTEGLNLLDIDFTFEVKKTVARRTYKPTSFNPYRAAGAVSGYEIHCGHAATPAERPLYTRDDQDAKPGEGAPSHVDGAAHPDKPIFGSFIHDLFRNPAFCQAFLNDLRIRHGLPTRERPLDPPEQIADRNLDRVAEMIREHWGPALSMAVNNGR